MQEEDRLFEQKMREVTARIPFYSGKWTNRSQSDPGMTILENLIVLLMLLEQQMAEVPEGIQRKFLELLGIHNNAGRSAKVLLLPKLFPEGARLPAHQKFYTGQMCFETIREEAVMTGQLKKVFRERDGGAIELKELEQGNPLCVKIFGEDPQKGDAVCLLFDFLPAKSYKPLHLYATVNQVFPRNPPGEGRYPDFARARWSYFTKKGFLDVDCEDDTGVFLRSGELKIHLGEEAPERMRIGEDSGYIVRCELLEAQYDISPYVQAVDGPLLEVYEMDSMALSYTARAGEKLQIPQVFQEETYTWIYEKGMGAYHLCAEPDMLKERKAICVRKDLMPYRDLGILYGYDRQEFDVGMLGRLLPESLELMAVKKQDNGKAEEAVFFRQAPRETMEGNALIFRYDETSRRIRILDVGDYTGWRLRICACATYHGEGGNILPHNTFIRAGAEKKELYENPNPGSSGRDPKDFSKLCRMLSTELKIPGAAATAADYEYLVRQVPGLCIHKVHAYKGQKKGTAEIVVKPWSESPRPVLSRTYQKCIAEYLEEKRLLHTDFRIRGPSYIQVDVWAVIFVKMQYQNCGVEIERLLREELDHVSGTGTFGEKIEFVKLLKKVEHLPCVDYVQDFWLNGGRKDILLPDDGLAYAGDVKLEVKRNEIL